MSLSLATSSIPSHSNLLVTATALLHLLIRVIDEFTLLFFFVHCSLLLRW